MNRVHVALRAVVSRHGGGGLAVGRGDSCLKDFMMLVAAFPGLWWAPGAEPRPPGRIRIRIYISEEQSAPQNEHMLANGRAARARIHRLPPGPSAGLRLQSSGAHPLGKKK